MNSGSPWRIGAALAVNLLLSNLVCAQDEEGERDAAFRVDARQTLDSWRKTSGHDEAAYLDNVDLTLDVNGEVAFGIPGLQLFASGLYNNGHVFNDKGVGSLQGVSNIEANHATRLYELWGEWRSRSGFSVRTGLYDLNSEFDAIETAGLFLNPSHGIGADYAQSGYNGPSIFPNAGMALRFNVEQGPWTVRAALFEAVPGDADRPDNMTLRWNEHEGVLYALEANRRLGQARAALGYWRYSKRFDAFAGPGEPATRSHSHGLYAFVESAKWRVTPTGDWRAFVRVGEAAAKVNAIEQYVGAGVVCNGFNAARPNDQVGVAVARAAVGDRWREVQPEATSAHETIWELTARFDFGKWFALQPNVQYLIRPGAVSEASEVWIMGVRFETGFEFAR